MTNEEFIKSVSLEGEEWRDVVGFEGLYMVSSFGRITSLFRQVEKGGSTSFLRPNIKGYFMTINGYMEVRLWKDNKEKLVMFIKLLLNLLYQIQTTTHK